MKTKRKENPKGMQAYVNHLAMFVTDFKDQSRVYHMGPVICLLLCTLGCLAIKLFSALHL